MLESASAAVGGFVRRNMPTRESVHQSWLLRPFAHRLKDPALWRLHRRSVPRAVALGLGIGVVIPFMHMVLAAMLAIPLRANVAVAAAFTLLVNPLTIPPLYYAAYRTGEWELGHHAAAFNVPNAKVSGEAAQMLQWLHDASGPWALGIITIAAAASLIGYGLSAIVWRGWLVNRWSRRSRRSRAS
ncbi:MAG: DUF2062 domain-containing protein [Sphingomicrobium sp.]